MRNLKLFLSLAIPAWFLVVIVAIVMLDPTRPVVTSESTRFLSHVDADQQFTEAWGAMIASILTFLAVSISGFANKRRMRVVQSDTRAINDAVNNRHVADPDGKALKMYDVLLKTHDEAREAKRLACENRDRLDTMVEFKQQVSNDLRDLRDEIMCDVDLDRRPDVDGENGNGTITP